MALPCFLHHGCARYRRNMTHLAKALKFGIRGRLPIRNTYKSRLQ